jgi:transitional endoplasmic reticulum ATPase
VTGQIGAPARVIFVSEDASVVYCQLQNGNVLPVGRPREVEGNVGDVVLVYGGGDEPFVLESAPRELWGEEPWVGVVKIKLDDVTVIESGGRYRRVPTSALEYEVGNTVEAGDFLGPTRLLADEPIRYIDLPTLDEVSIDAFRRTESEADPPTFKDFGGLSQVTERARELIALSLRRKEDLTAIGSRPVKGVLFTGEPGTGKTLLARIIAAETDAVFYEISGPEIFSKWLGQSGALLRGIFEQAATHDSAIVFFDELDSVASRRNDDAHEETKRVVAQLLTLMDGFVPNTNVVVIATTNRPGDIDLALRRPGRLDWEIHFPRPTASDRKEMLRASGRRMKCHGDLPIDWVAARTSNWTAADLRAIWVESGFLAVADDRPLVSVEDFVGGYERVRSQMMSKARTTLT